MAERLLDEALALLAQRGSDDGAARSRSHDGSVAVTRGPSDARGAASASLVLCGIIRAMSDRSSCSANETADVVAAKAAPAICSALVAAMAPLMHLDPYPAALPADAARVSAGVRSALHAPLVRRVLRIAPPALLHAVRDFIRTSHGSAQLHLGRAWISSACGRLLAPFLPELQNQLLSRPSVFDRLLRASHTMTPAHTAELLAYVRLLLKLGTCCAVAMAPEAFGRLLECCARCTPAARPLLWSLLASQLDLGLAIAHIDLAQAVELAPILARTAADASISTSPFSLGTDLGSLGWFHREDLRSLLESFPVSMLMPVPPDTKGHPTSSGRAAPADHLHAAVAPPPRRGPAMDAFSCLLLLHCLLRSGTCDARLWLAHGAPGLLAVSLCAESGHVRRLGYEALGLFMKALSEGPSFAERPQITRLLCSLRDAVTEVDQHIPSTVTSFVSQGLYVLMRPAHAQYRPINQLLLSRPYLDLADIPLFFSHFHGGSSSGQPREDRLWLLVMLRNGLMAAADVQLFAKRHVLQLLLSFYDSPLSDTPSRRVCLAVLQRAAMHRVAAAYMLGPLGLPAWICSHAAREAPLEFEEMTSLLLTLVRSPSLASLAEPLLDQCGHAVVALHQAAARRLPAASRSLGEREVLLAEVVVALAGPCQVRCSPTMPSDGH